MTNIKNKLLSVAICFLMLVSICGLGLSMGGNQATPVSAETISVQTEDDFWLVPGARVRYAADGVTGISYRFQVKDSVYQANKSNYTAVKYGILIAPKEGYDLSYNNVFGPNAIYDWAEKDGEGNYVYNGTKTRIVNLEASTLKTEVANVNGEETLVRYFNGNMVNIKSNNLLREFQAKAYFAYSTDGENFTYVDNIVGDESNVRSIVYVAQMALQDTSADAPTPEQAQLLEQTYMTETVINTKTTYTTEHYAMIGGEYQVIATDVTENVTLGQEVQAVAKTIDGFTYDPSNQNNVLSGTVLANGRLVLKRYYTGTTCTLTLNGGDLVSDPNFTGESSNVEAGYGQTVELGGFSCYGYTLIGWQKENGQIVIGNSYVCTGSETLTAVWIKDAFSLRWGQWTPIS